MPGNDHLRGEVTSLQGCVLNLIKARDILSSLSVVPLTLKALPFEDAKFFVLAKMRFGFVYLGWGLDDSVFDPSVWAPTLKAVSDAIEGTAPDPILASLSPLEPPAYLVMAEDGPTAEHKGPYITPQASSPEEALESYCRDLQASGVHPLLTSVQVTVYPPVLGAPSFDATVFVDDHPVVLRGHHSSDDEYAFAVYVSGTPLEPSLPDPPVGFMLVEGLDPSRDLRSLAHTEYGAPANSVVETIRQQGSPFTRASVALSDGMFLVALPSTLFPKTF